MAEYIDRENYCKNICLCWGGGCEKSKCPIWTAPAADVAPVRHARWNRPYISWFFPLKIKDSHCYCTHCGNPAKHRKTTNYCSYCGAIMDGGELQWLSRKC